MSFFYVINGKKLKRYFVIFVAAIFAAGIFYTERNNVSVFSASDPQVIYSVDTDSKTIALTFDISWGDKQPKSILKILEDKGVKNATFFLSAPWSQTHQEIVDRIKKDGFEIGSHGNEHLNYSTLKDEQIRQQISTADQILSKATGNSVNLIRLPNGDFDKRVLRIADELHYTVIQWDTDSLDWMNKGVDNIVNRVVTKAHPGDIILLHASDSCTQTAPALPTIIDQLRGKSYQFATVTQLIQQVNVNHQQIQDQTSQNLQATE